MAEPTRRIEVNVNGFGMFALFTKASTKETLIEASGMNGYYLSELGIEYKSGDEVRIKSDAPINGQFVYDVKILKVTDKLFEAEFIKKPL